MSSVIDLLQRSRARVVAFVAVFIATQAVVLAVTIGADSSPGDVPAISAAVGTAALIAMTRFWARQDRRPA